MSQDPQRSGSIRGVLLDLDGVLYTGDSLIEGAVASIDWLQAQGLPFRYITNTSTQTREQLQSRLEKLGLPVDVSIIFSAVQATEAWLNDQGITRVAPLVNNSVAERLSEGFQIDRERPEAVIIGDIGDAWDYALLQQAFEWLLDGARLVAIHHNRYSRSGNKLVLDIGAFVVVLEYAAQTQAVVVGKPSVAFFHAACDSLSLSPEEVVVVGDDIDADVGGAQEAGCIGVLVETGKYRAELVKRSGVRPDFQIVSIAKLPELLAAAPAD
ncbi:TIGR01458 family HAD-type hydrolase [Marinobacterium mangrovicola]|uniref:Haloacid dehalogenase-like hydrolase domain-containing protein 2 n=1 Tax=Marinobacterium mangrovicola TaxID=1476959 RepID=A0A4R1GY47_9GAMM|nr:TIGR01458 family HAD-type hydrolase [Marinobacterium mangrovicola]TCK09402.1 HAD superfamily hydrolase (TIGR01458 family) [Marinobacterium mangrovicola]